MKKLLELLKEARPEIIGGVISGLVVAAVIAVASKAFAKTSIKQAAILSVIVALAVFGLLYAGATVGTPFIVVGAVIGSLICTYVAFRLRHPRKYDKKSPPKLRWLWQYRRWYAVSGKGPWKYRKWRPLALAGLVIILILASGTFGYQSYIESRPPSKVIVLVADFDGPGPYNYGVTDAILNNLRRALKPYNRLIAQ